MALVVLLRGVNVGGHRRLRPRVLAEQLAHLDVVNIGAAGTLVVRGAVTRRRLRSELAALLPFETAVAMVDGREIERVLRNGVPEAGRPDARTTRFVSVLARAPRAAPSLPRFFPSRRAWLLHVVARRGRVVIGRYRRDMKVIGLLGEIDRLFGTAATTRSWSTLAAIGKVLGATPRGVPPATIAPRTHRGHLAAARASRPRP